MGAVDVDERGNRVLRMLDLGNGRGATTCALVLNMDLSQDEFTHA